MDFGDPYTLESLSLPRRADGYAVQYLGQDMLLDRSSGEFRPIRDPRATGIFASFNSAREAALAWLETTGRENAPLAIVPAAYDSILHRHILIHGVLQPGP